jgi:hypothetical protein
VRRIEHGKCNELTLSTKAWYAVFLLSKDSSIGPEFFQAVSPVFQQKPGTQLFFFRKTSLSARESSEPARL